VHPAGLQGQCQFDFTSREREGGRIGEWSPLAVHPAASFVFYYFFLRAAITLTLALQGPLLLLGRVLLPGKSYSRVGFFYFYSRVDFTPGFITLTLALLLPVDFTPGWIYNPNPGSVTPG
jgi:hypothetical protein